MNIIDPSSYWFLIMLLDIDCIHFIILRFSAIFKTQKKKKINTSRRKYKKETKMYLSYESLLYLVIKILFAIEDDESLAKAQKVKKKQNLISG